MLQLIDRQIGCGRPLVDRTGPHQCQELVPLVTVFLRFRIESIPINQVTHDATGDRGVSTGARLKIDVAQLRSPCSHRIPNSAKK